MRRIVTALVLMPAAVALVLYSSPRFLLVTLRVLGTFCLHEYFQLAGRMGFRGQPWLGYGGFWLLLVGFHEKYLSAPALLSGVLAACFVAAMWRRDPIRERVAGMMVNVLGMLYLALFLYPALPIRYDFGERLGRDWTLILLAIVWAGDISALLVGKSFGRTPFSPVLSPKKTNEGALGGLAAGVIVAAALQHLYFTDLPLNHVVILSLLLGMVGQLGDLAESMLKRAAEVKDSSDLIPGHGGVLDRIDSLLFAIPVLYIYLQRLYG